MTAVHSKFEEARPSELTVVCRYRDTDREVKLRADASAALSRLLAEAKAAGNPIMPISGFRTIEYQLGLFQKAIVKHGSEEAAGRWVARPGYSEHHTGLAVDVGVEDDPSLDVETRFEETSAFRWLQQNAERFGFELSYPRNNTRGINYEPWHWRFVGTPEAKQVFET